ncbi:porin [Pseudomonas sp. NPDC078700]|uniref:porin n=1 Tax=Pseudomonas sp. NPDC078700 TaxID=3364424 RepID=UPI0037C95022
MIRGYVGTTSLVLLLQAGGLATSAHADGFPAIGRIASGFGYYAIDTGYDDMLKVYGSLDAFASYHDSEHHSGYKVEGGGAWTNKLGVYARKAIAPDTVLEFDLEEGFNLNGEALDGTWKDVGALRLAVATLRSKQYGKLEVGKTYSMGTPTYADPFLAVYGSPYTYLTTPAAGKGAYYLDLRPKYTMAYTTPSYNGFTLGTALTFGFGDVASSGKTVRGRGARLQYKNSRTILLASYNQYYSDPWEDAGRTTQTRNDYKSLSAFYDFGPLSSSFTWQRQDVNESGSPSVTAYTLGLMMPVGKADIARLLVVQREVEFGSKDATGVMLGYDHFFNPNWAVYGRVGMISNQSKSSLSYAGTPVDQPGDDPQNLMLGVYYHF